MAKYSEQKPRGGRDVVKAGDVKPPGTPQSVLEDHTPLTGLVDENGHVQLDTAIPYLIAETKQLRKQMKEAEQSQSFQNTATAGDFEEKLKNAQKWGGWIWGVGAGLFSVVAFVFAAGVTWQVFVGANATDDEVQKFVYEAIVEHNGGVDPWAKNGETHKPLGHHAEIEKLLDTHQERLDEIAKQLSEGQKAQVKRDLQSEYQFEFSRWQALVIEAERQGRTPPGKPREVRDLEKVLMGFGKPD